MGNAIKFTNEGEIRITVELIRESFGNLVLLFSIDDTGIGIRKEKLNTIFSSYSQASSDVARQFGGTGLGTSICRQLVELMEGEIWAESPSPLSKNLTMPGSRFSFTIELFSDNKFDKDVDYEGVSEIKQLKIMFIEKPGNKQNLLRNSFVKIGTKLDTVHDLEGVKKLMSSYFIKSSRHNIIFIEHTVDFDGFEFARFFDNYDYAKRYIIIMLSANDEIGNYAKCKRLKIDYYITKPYDTNEILSIIYKNFPKIKPDKKERIEKDFINKDASILVAEDNVLNQMVAKTIFKSFGYEIDIAVNGNKAVEMVRNKQYDVVFMDFMMPIKDGLQATTEIRKQGFKMPIIAMTGKTSDEDRKNAEDAGMNDYILKPMTISVIKNTLMKWILR